MNCAAGQGGAGGQFFDWRLKSLCDFWMDISGRGQMSPAVGAELLGLGVIRMTLEAFHGPFPLALVGKRITPPMGVVNMARRSSWHDLDAHFTEGIG